MSETYSVVLTGSVLNDQPLEEVKAKVAEAFKLKAPQLDKLFSGKPVAIKRGLDKKQAVKLSARIQQLGAHVVIKAVADKPVVPKAEPEQKPVERVEPPVVEAVEEIEPATTSEKAETVTKEKPSTSAADEQEAMVTCPRCGHEQPHTLACGYCKMDLTLHLQRVARKARIRAAKA